MNSRFWCLLFCCVTFIAEAGLEIGLFDSVGRPESLHGKIRMEKKKSSGAWQVFCMILTLKYIQQNTAKKHRNCWLN